MGNQPANKNALSTPDLRRNRQLIKSPNSRQDVSLERKVSNPKKEFKQILNEINFDVAEINETLHFLERLYETQTILRENMRFTYNIPMSCSIEEIKNEEPDSNNFFVKLDGINAKSKKNANLIKITNDFKLESKHGDFNYYDLLPQIREENMKKSISEEKKPKENLNFMVSLKNRPSLEQSKKKKRSSLKDKTKENNFSNILSNKFETDDENEKELETNNKNASEKNTSKHSNKSKSKENTSTEIKPEQLENYEYSNEKKSTPKLSSEIVKNEEPNPFRSSFASDPAEEFRKCELNYERIAQNNFDQTKNTIDLPSDFSTNYNNCPIDLVEIINKDSLFLSKYSEREHKNNHIPEKIEIKSTKGKFNLKDQISKILNNVEDSSKTKKWEKNKFDANVIEKESRNNDRLFSENELCISQEYQDYEFKEMISKNPIENDTKSKFSIVKNYQPEKSLISKIKNYEKDARMKEKSKLSDSTIISKASTIRSITPNNNPKKNQLAVKDHYLNRESSYSKINEKKKQISNNDFQKLMNKSNLDVKIEKSNLNNSYVISPYQRDDRFTSKNKLPISKLVANQKNIQSEQNLTKLDPVIQITEKTVNKKGNISTSKQSLSSYANRPAISSPIKNEIIPNIEINLNKFTNTKPKEQEKHSDSIENAEEENNISNPENNLLANVKLDIDNLKNKMKDTFSEKFLKISNQDDCSIKSSLETEKALDQPKGTSLKYRISQALSKKTIDKNDMEKQNLNYEEQEELPIQIAMKMMPDYEMFSQEDQKCSSEEEN